MKQKVKVISAIIVSAIVLMACNSVITFPPVSQTPTNNHNQGQFVWHDLATYDPLSAKDFYADVFGWEFETVGAGENMYYVIKNDGVAIGGLFKLADEYGKAAEWIGSMSVPDVDVALQYNQAAGGKTIFKKAAFKGRGETALVQDPQGAFIAFLNSESGDPNPRRAGNISMNSWLWNELWTNDLEGSIEFYKGLTGAESQEVEAAKVPYYLFNNDGNTFSGAIGNPVEGARSAWMPYIKVKDVNTTVEKAKAAGAHVMMEPTPSIRKGTVAVLMDPTGAQFTIQQWILR
ncbi:VOC family protein [Draconibacterium mangrovi]|uniref:VOC family protein n=1 Tax=Draconibacterium mangrovi TaxID=2697469 RepID=UPI0013D6DDFF|nr:VOC family protein [Draconibacterium mangrovi]